jgi:hypothetical protein
VVRSTREALTSRIHFIMQQRRGAVPTPTPAQLQAQAQAQAQAHTHELLPKLHNLLSSSRLVSTTPATPATPRATLATDADLMGLPQPLAFEITSGDDSAPTGLRLLAKLVTRSVRLSVCLSAPPPYMSLASRPRDLASPGGHPTPLTPASNTSNPNPPGPSSQSTYSRLPRVQGGPRRFDEAFIVQPRQ